MLVSAADKLHNLRSIQADYRALGNAVFERFSAPEEKRANVLWYYRALYDVYVDGQTSPPDPRRDRLTIPLAEILTWFDDRTPANEAANGNTPRLRLGT